MDYIYIMLLAVETLMGYVRLYWKISPLHKLAVVVFMPFVIFLYVLFVFSDVIRLKTGVEGPLYKWIDKDVAKAFHKETL